MSGVDYRFTDTDSSGHDWKRTIPTDGKWCVICGLAYSNWPGDGCPGPVGALERIEATLVERNREDRAALDRIRALTLDGSLCRTDCRQSVKAALRPASPEGQDQ